jgi:hypothetical protein
MLGTGRMIKSRQTGAGNQSQEEGPALSGAFLRPVRIRLVPWLIPNWARAQTWGNLVLVKRATRLTPELLAHELAHVLQWRSLGVVAFVSRYACYLIRHGYQNNPLEIVARLAATDEAFLNWARAILRARQNRGN